MRFFGLFGWPFAIRQPTSKLVRLLLAGAFCLVVFCLWIFATDNPRWLNRLIVRAQPQYELKAGDAVDLTIDREHAQLLVTKRATGRTIVRDLPRIAAGALPAFEEASYGPLFRQLLANGLGRFEKKGPFLYHAVILDGARAGDRLRGVGPYPRERPLREGEPVDVRINFTRQRARLVVDRVGRGLEGMLSKVAPAGARFPPRIGDYPDLPRVAERFGVGALVPNPTLTAEDLKDQSFPKMFVGEVRDVQKAAERLGPSNPIPALAAGEEIAIQLDPKQSVVVLRRAGDEKGKRQTITLTTSLLSPAAIPELRLASYPGLEAALATDGVAVRESAAGLEAEVGDLALARENGLGLERPAALRLLTQQTLPSPTEVLESLPNLWTERDLLGATRITLERICLGFAWAALFTLPLGMLMGAFTRIGSFFEPFRLTGMYIPLPAFIPLTIAWAGIGEPQMVLFLALCNAVVLLPFSVSAIQAIPQVYLDTARTLGATRGQQFRYVLLSISWSSLFKGLRTTFAVGWTWMMLAEMNGAKNGLGYIINTSQRRGYIAHVYVVIALVIALAFICNTLWSVSIWILFPHEREKRS